MIWSEKSNVEDDSLSLDKYSLLSLAFCQDNYADKQNVKTQYNFTLLSGNIGGNCRMWRVLDTFLNWCVGKWFQNWFKKIAPLLVTYISSFCIGRQLEYDDLP